MSSFLWTDFGAGLRALLAVSPVFSYRCHRPQGDGASGAWLARLLKRIGVDAILSSCLTFCMRCGRIFEEETKTTQVVLSVNTRDNKASSFSRGALQLLALGVPNDSLSEEDLLAALKLLEASGGPGPRTPEISPSWERSNFRHARWPVYRNVGW
jgi:hypothetical protein